MMKIDEKAQSNIDKVSEYPLAKKSLKRYILSRGIESLPLEIFKKVRCKNKYPYYEDREFLGDFIALFFPIMSAVGNIVSYLRIYLDSDSYCKAGVDSPKKMMKAPYPGASKGAAIRLMEATGETLALAEGIETALAVSSAIQWIPVWCGINAGLMKTIVLPEHVKVVHIFADNDTAGIDSAFALGQRLSSEGRKVYIHIPEKNKTDWLNVLNESGPEFIEETVEIAISEESSRASHHETANIPAKEKKGHKYSNLDENEEIESLKFSNDLEDVIKYFNHKHFVVSTGKAVRIAHEGINEEGYKTLDLLDRTSFDLMYNNWSVTLGKDDDAKPLKAASLWLQSQERRQFDKIIFEPEVTCKRFYNMYKGLEMTPKPGCCEKFLDHMRNNICAKNALVFIYVLKWIAHIFQKPGELPGVGLVLVGQQGTGKSIFADSIGALLGSYYFKLSNTNQILSKFNSHVVGNLLIFSDEYSAPGQKTTPINALLTEKKIGIEKKGQDIIQVSNFARFIFASNDKKPMELNISDRRFLVLKVSDNKRQNQDYFKDLMDEMEHGGYEALLDYLLKVDLSGFNVRKAPFTAYKAEMILSSLEPFEKWLYDSLQRGRLYGSGNREWENVIPKDELFNSFHEWHINSGLFQRFSPATFGKKLFEIFKHEEVNETRLSPDDTRKRSYTFPALSRCRKTFESYLGLDGNIWDNSIEPSLSEFEDDESGIGNPENDLDEIFG
jgi:hypothetical protein